MSERMEIVSADATLVAYFKAPEGVDIEVQRTPFGRKEESFTHVIKVMVTAATTEEVRERVGRVREAILEALS